MESFPLSVNSVTLGPPPVTVAAALSPERRDERIGPAREPRLHLALVSLQVQGAREADERGSSLVRLEREVSREVLDVRVGLVIVDLQRRRARQADPKVDEGTARTAPEKAPAHLELVVVGLDPHVSPVRLDDDLRGRQPFLLIPLRPATVVRHDPRLDGNLRAVPGCDADGALVRVDRDLAVSRERQRLRNRAVGDGRGSRQENGQDSLKDVFHEEPLCGKTHSAENGSARRPGPGPSARVLGAKTRIEIERCNTRKSSRAEWGSASPGGGWPVPSRPWASSASPRERRSTSSSPGACRTATPEATSAGRSHASRSPAPPRGSSSATFWKAERLRISRIAPRRCIRKPVRARSWNCASPAPSRRCSSPGKATAGPSGSTSSRKSSSRSFRPCTARCWPASTTS